ncbi:MAG: DUF4242 domain-containing protein [Pseudorhodoplanes sp.]|jgi:cation diffusion facilitator CzcD-associated flavoprotein CzcO|nr:DUF4242 domain-containing protein [Pseudorhodoplanes sp.]
MKVIRNDLISIVGLQAPLDSDGVRRLARHGCLDIHQVDWLRAYLATSGKRMLCCYQAADAESVRHVLRHQGFPDAAVWEVEVSGGSRNESARKTSEWTIVELALDAADQQSALLAQSRAVDALETAGRLVEGVFASKSSGRLICLVDGHDEASLDACLRAAQIVPVGIWRCAEFDPRPRKLFESGATETRFRFETKAARAAATDLTDKISMLDAVIIGAGISGICALQRFLRMGLRTRLFESGSDVGGVWHWNRYPGARVDSETYTYLFSFSEELLRDWDWQELFAVQPEISRYLRHVVERFDLRRHMRFDAPVAAASYDEAGRHWWIETEDGERVAARYLIAAAGTLSAPQLPHYPGEDTFAGESCHTARWPAAGIELEGKRVAVIGTGASGVQVIQTIADRVGQLSIFQRTPTYCIPQRNRPLTQDDRQEIRRCWGRILAACRESYGGFIHNFDPRSGLAVSAEEREALFEELWQRPGFAFWFGNFADLMMNLEVNAYASDFIRRKIMARVHDPDVARKLVPDHPIGTKRVPLEKGYYEVYNRANVRLIDLRETPIERITPAGIRTSDEEHGLDVIIYATGFDAGTGSLTRIDIRGKGGLSLAEKWRDGPATFLGLLVSGFPNFFMVNGPHNAAALCNAGRCIEQNVDWIARCIGLMRAQNLNHVVPTPVAEQEWTEHVYDVANGSVLGKMTNSWFFGANTPGKPRRVTIYAAGARKYREHCDDVASAGYPGLMMS